MDEELAQSLIDDLDWSFEPSVIRNDTAFEGYGVSAIEV